MTVSSIKFPFSHRNQELVEKNNDVILHQVTRANFIIIVWLSDRASDQVSKSAQRIHDTGPGRYMDIYRTNAS